MDTHTELDFNNLSHFESAVVLSSIYDVITLATRCRGYVFGGFVRDVIVPKSVDPKCPVKFKDVDLWFKDQDDAEQFVYHMGKGFVKSPVEVTKDAYPGAFKRTQYYLIKYNTCIAWFDVVVSPYVPVDDFDVNTLAYRRINDEFVTFGSTISNNLVNQIKKKRAIMLASYTTKMSQMGCMGKYFTDRFNKLLKQGWTIYSINDDGDMIKYYGNHIDML